MYYTIVLIIAILLLIGSLSVVGVMITSGSNKKAFPEFQNTCPDFWTHIKDSDNNIVCKPPTSGINTVTPILSDTPPFAHAGVDIGKNTDGKSIITGINLNSSNWISLCDKANWAKTNKITWDGVTNTNEC